MTNKVPCALSGTQWCGADLFDKETETQDIEGDPRIVEMPQSIQIEGQRSDRTIALTSCYKMDCPNRPERQ